MVNVLAWVAAVLCMTVVFQKKAEVVIALSICMAMPVLLALAMAGQLSFVDVLAWPVMILSLAGCAICLAKEARRTGKGIGACCREAFLHRVCTPGMLCGLLLLAFWFTGSQTRRVIGYDEMNYWATRVRSLFWSNGFLPGSRTCVSNYASYMPGMQLMEWWFMHVRGQWHEGTLYGAYFFVSSLFALPLTAKLKRWWQAPLAAVAIVAMPTLFTSDYYSTLATDGAQAMMYGLLLYVLWTERKSRSTFGMVMTAGLAVALTLTKQAGLLWVLLGLLCWVCVARGQGRWKRPAVALGAALACSVAWRVFCAAQGLTNAHVDNVSSALAELTINADTLSVWRGIIKILLLTPSNGGGGWDEMRSLAGLPGVVWIALGAAALLLAGRREKEAKRCAVWLLTVFGTYAVLYILSIPTLFKPEVYHWAKDRQALLEVMDRYFMPMYMGAAVLCFAVLTDAEGHLRLAVRWRNAALGACLAAALCMTCWPNLVCLTQKGYEARFGGRESGSEWLRENLTWAQQIEDWANSRVLTTVDVSTAFRYGLVPLSIVYLYPPAQEMTAQELRQWLDDRLDSEAVTHVADNGGDENARLFFEKAFGEALTPGIAYRVDRSQRPYRLVPQAQP